MTNFMIDFMSKCDAWSGELFFMCTCWSFYILDFFYCAAFHIKLEGKEICQTNGTDKHFFLLLTHSPHMAGVHPAVM